MTHFGPLSIKWALFRCHLLPECCFCSCPSCYDHSVSSNMITHHVTHLRSLEIGFLTMTISSLYSNDIFGIRWNRRFTHGCGTEKAAVTVWWCHVNMNKSLSSTLLLFAMTAALKAKINIMNISMFIHARHRFLFAVINNEKAGFVLWKKEKQLLRGEKSQIFTLDAKSTYPGTKRGSQINPGQTLAGGFHDS